MGGAIPALGADSMRRLTARFNLSSGAGSAHSLQSGLFEQLLSAAPSRIDQQSFSSSANEANYAADCRAARDRESSSPSATQGSDREDRPDVQADDDDRTEATAAAAPPVGWSGNPLPTPLPADEDAAAGHTVEVNAEAADGDSADVGTGAETRAAGAAADKRSDAGETVASTLDDLPSGPSNTVVGEAADSQRAGLDDGAFEEASLGSSASTQAATGRTASSADATTGSAIREPEAASAGGQVIQAGELSAATKAAAETSEGDLSGSVAGGDVAGGDVAGGEQLRPALSDERPADAKQQTRAQGNSASAEDAAGASGQADNASTRGGKSRDSRREKWFQRDEGQAGAARGAPAAPNASSGNPGSSAAADVAAGRVNAHSGAMAAAMDEGSSPASQGNAAAMLPETLSPVQPPAMQAAAMATDRGPAAIDNLGNAAQAGDRQLAQGDAVETSRGQFTTQRTTSQGADAKSAAADAERPDVLTQAERVRLVQRVSRSFARLGPMGGQISLKLHPPQLGSLNVQVRLEGRSMTAKLSTESSAARDAILESLPVLRTRLAEQGFEIGSFEVEVADNQADVGSGRDSSRPGSDQMGGRERRQAEQGTDYRRLAAQQRPRSDGYDVVPNSVRAGGGAAWELPRGVDVQA